MQLKITPGFVFTFLLLLLVMMELHELVHITVGRMICGCWGSRDFNVWSLCEGCQKNQPSRWWLATLAGPLFSFLMMWVGRYLLSKDVKRKAIGFSLIFANIPLGRITTVMMGGGDEMVVTRYLLKERFADGQMILLCSAIVLLAGGLPVAKAFQTLSNRRSWIVIVGFLTLPLLFLLTYLLTGLNTLLSNGFLAQPWIMGTPLLITVHTLIAFILLTIICKNLVNQTGTTNSIHY